MTHHESSLEYAKRRANETRRAYVTVLWADNTDGPTMLDCGLARREWGKESRFVRTNPQEVKP